MKTLIKELLNEAEISRLASAVDGGKCPAVISGVSPVHKAAVLAALMEKTGESACVICSDDNEAKRFASDIAAFTGKKAHLLTSREFVFYNVEGVSRQAEQERIRVLFNVLSDDPGVIVATVEGIMERTMPPELLKSLIFEIKMGGTYSIEQVVSALVGAGYIKADQVEGVGQYSVRGGIVDFFTPVCRYPVRVEFWGDEVDSMSLFDPATQRRTDAIDSALILPSSETVAAAEAAGGADNKLLLRLKELKSRLGRRKKQPEEFLKNLDGDIDRLESGRPLPSADKYMELIYDKMCSPIDYIPEHWPIYMCEPARCTDRAKNFEMQHNEDVMALLETGVLEASLVKYIYSWSELCTQAEEHPFIMADSFAANAYPSNPLTLVSLKTKQLASYGGSLETALSDIGYYVAAGYMVVIFCADMRRGELLREFLKEHGMPCAVDEKLSAMPPEGTCVISVGILSSGMEFPALKLAVITEGQLMAAPTTRKRKAKATTKQRLASYTDLSPGDLVVHEQHGIGRFVGIFKMPVDGVEKDYIKIAYAGADSLYVPATNLDMVSKYIGGGEDSPVKLSKMGGTDWAKTKTKAKGAAKQMAKQLIQLYAQRQKAKGYAFQPDTVWQTEFEEAFGYQETEDQLRCIDEIKEDMEKPVPMDRLLCGDVGYGKTEVALRAVMKCILGGKQAAILVPTTVLAQQHYVTILKRFADFPVKAAILSRFCTQTQIKSVIRDIKSGSVDIVVGTHRLLQKDIQFKDLGLLIVDEEQRFGVTHKEALKEMTKNVDVLTLSATPIPRTLNMALSGIRDMSAIEEPPKNRQPVQTFVLEHDWGILADAMRRELGRGGQIYYLHNRIDNIERTAAHISEITGGASVGVAHGRMDEDSLSDVMERMSTGELQILVCTTIIETGIDIPNVNTLIVEDADKMGLAQLHQIRGRVGRSPRRAYAYFTFRQGKALSEIAEKRLTAIREFAEFNSGFKIAMRDLEIRGAGNLLGAEQSGHMMSVGYDMYLKLLEEAVLEEKGEKLEKRTECSADIAVSANIPEKYVPSGEQRMDLYRRIALIRNEEEADEMISELIDRYGDPPSQVIALVNIALLRGAASAAGIPEISQKAGWLRFKIDDFDMAQVSALYARPEYKGRVKIEAGMTPMISLKIKSQRVIDEATQFIKDYAAAKKVNNA